MIILLTLSFENTVHLYISYHSYTLESHGVLKSLLVDFVECPMDMWLFIHAEISVHLIQLKGAPGDVTYWNGIQGILTLFNRHNEAPGCYRNDKYLNWLVPMIYRCNFYGASFNFFYSFVTADTCTIMSSGERHGTLLMISEHWIRHGAIKQQAIILANTDQVLCLAWSLWDFTGVSAVMLPWHLSTFRKGPWL